MFILIQPLLLTFSAVILALNTGCRLFIMHRMLKAHSFLSELEKLILRHCV